MEKFASVNNPSWATNLLQSQSLNTKLHLYILRFHILLNRFPYFIFNFKTFLSLTLHIIFLEEKFSLVKIQLYCSSFCCWNLKKMSCLAPTLSSKFKIVIYFNMVYKTNQKDIIWEYKELFSK